MGRDATTTGHAVGLSSGPSSGLTTETVPASPKRLQQTAPLLPALTILAHPQLDRVGDRVVLGELVTGREFSLSRLAPRFTAPGAGAGEPLADRFLSRQPVILRATDHGGVRVWRSARGSELVIDGVVVDQAYEVAGPSLANGVVLEIARRVALLLHLHPVDCQEPDGVFDLVGAGPAMAAVRAAIRRLGAFEVPVLIRGETGTGKELVARALHDHGRRSGRAFVGVSLAALAPSLAVAELFGAVKGAFTGAAQDRRGYFERAQNGTLFLDEIGEAPADIQVMLLRALETGEILPAGASVPKKLDVRLLSATDADLEQLGADGRFRLPLLHRLAGYVLRVPPLRERSEDIGRLLVHFLRRELRAVGEGVPADPSSPEPWLPPALMSRLVHAAWPGNVRQLANVARQLVIDAPRQASLQVGPRLDELLGQPTWQRPLEASVAVEPVADEVDGAEARPRRRKPSQVSEDELIAALRANRFNLKATASALGIPRTSLYSRIERSTVCRAASDVPADEIRRAFEAHDGDLDAMVAELEVSDRALRQRLKFLGLR